MIALSGFFLVGAPYRPEDRYGPVGTPGRPQTYTTSPAGRVCRISPASQLVGAFSDMADVAFRRAKTQKHRRLASPYSGMASGDREWSMEDHRGYYKTGLPVRCASYHLQMKSAQ